MNPSAADLATLQGTWQQTYIEADGTPNPPDEYAAPGTLTTITNQTFHVRHPNGTTLLQGTFELDATTSPKSITWTDSIGPDTGKPLPAIYHLTETHFTFIAADENTPRPQTFQTSQGQTLRTFHRHPP